MVQAPPRERELLLIPGPVSVDEDVLDALARPIRAHYGRHWVELYQAVTHDLAGIFGTRSEVHLLFGPGSAGLEMGLASTLGPGDRLLVCANGFFGRRLVQIGQALGLAVEVVEAPLGQPIDPQDVRRALARAGHAAVAVVHHETMVGGLNPVAQIAAAAEEADALVLVDAVSSLGGVDFRMDRWGVDIAVSVANKCLGAPAGLAPVAVSRRAWERVEDGRPKAAGWYLNLQTWRWYRREWGPWHPHPTTMPSSILEALAAALRRILDEGLEEHLARHAQAGARLRQGLRRLGFQLVAADEFASPVTTAVWALPGMDVNHYMAWLSREHGLRVSGGLAELAGKVFRVGTMGRAADPAVIERYLAATEAYLKR